MNDEELQIAPAPIGPRDATLNVHQRIQKIKEQIHYIKKDKKVENYMAVTHDMVTAVTRPHFVAYGINIVARVVNSQTVDTGRRSEKGNTAWRYEGRYEVDFINVDDPQDKAMYVVDAHADDFGDKAPGKGLSYAVKSAILKLLQLEAGIDDESRVKGETPPPLSDDEIAGLKQQMDAATSRASLTAMMPRIFKIADDAKDKEAHTVLRDYGLGLIKKLPKEAA